MRQNVNFNGKVVSVQNAFFQSDNRSFKYGDGLFETIRVFKGEAVFLDYHFKRLEKGLAVLKYKIPEFYSTVFFEKEIQKLTKGKGNHRIRITVFRSAGGLYTPKNNFPQFLIEIEALENAFLELNKNGLRVGIYNEMKISYNILTSLKTCNSLPYILAGLYSREQGFDDCFLINNNRNIAESSSSNLFLIKQKKLITPSLSEACVDGTMRKIIIEIANQNGFKIIETSVEVTDLNQADELWLTNAIQGIRWIKNFDDKTFDNKIAKDFVKLLNKKIIEN